MNPLFDTHLDSMNLNGAISSVSCPYARYDSEYTRQMILEKLNHIKETNQPCFVVIAEGATSYGPRNEIYCVFPDMFIKYLSDACVHTPSYLVTLHKHSLFILTILKNCKITQNNSGGPTMDTVLKNIQSIEDSHMLQMEKSKKELEIEKDEIRKCKEHLKKDQHDFFIEKQSFEQEKTKLKSDQKYLCELYEEINDTLSSKREEFEKNQQILDYDRQTFEKEKSAFTCIQTLFYELVEKDKQKLMTERKEFEQDKLKLESELDKYKKIISNCQMEIKAYGL